MLKLVVRGHSWRVGVQPRRRRVGRLGPLGCSKCDTSEYAKGCFPPLPQSIILIYCHWNCCIQFLVAAAQNFPHNCWPEVAGIIGRPAFVQYSYAFFKTVSNMMCIGYGSPGTGPLRTAETWVTSVSILMGSGLFVTLAGVITTLLVQMDSLDSEYRCGPISTCQGHLCRCEAPRPLCLQHARVGPPAGGKSPC